MKKFLDEHFLLTNPTALQLYQDHADDLPIIDYHCHLSPELIAIDKQFTTLTEAWLNGDHYKWRAMRANGVDESYCTGNQPDWEKFRQWAYTVPYTLRNPLYHWTHLELQRYFDIGEVLNPDSAQHIYNTCNEKLQSPEYSVRHLLRKMNVKLVCTTDDPIDSLEFHAQIKHSGFEIPVLPAFRPDLAMKVDAPFPFIAYVKKLGALTNIDIGTIDHYLTALRSRHDFFGSMGCCISDHGLESIPDVGVSDVLAYPAFRKIMTGEHLTELEQGQIQVCLLRNLAEWDREKGWVQQFHLGAMRNNNSRMRNSLGPDTGWDSIGDFVQGRALSRLLDRLDRDNLLPKTILYNLNPADNELMATMAGNFNDGSTAGKIQWGAAWWFLDQKEGMTKQINALSSMGLLSRFVGMITDSRSFLSYPRHEYFRRILCNLFGEEIERGELPDDRAWIGKIIEDICYHNARNYFNWTGAWED